MNIRHALLTFLLLALAIVSSFNDPDGASAQTIQFAPETHVALARQARAVLQGDGQVAALVELDKTTTERPPKTRLDAIVDGVRAADVGQSDMNFGNAACVGASFRCAYVSRHAHGALTHRGWVFTRRTCDEFSSPDSAGNEAQRWFDYALVEWQRGNDYTAMFYLGVSLHLVQDQSVPHHAAATIESSASLHGFLAIVCGGTRPHDDYENWVKRNYQLLFQAFDGGLYDLTNPANWRPRGRIHRNLYGHVENAYSWVDNASHEGFDFYDEVDSPGETKCRDLPQGTNSACYKVASILTPSAQRRGAGFISHFFASVGGLQPGFWTPVRALGPREQVGFVTMGEVVDPEILSQLITLQDSGELPVTASSRQFWYGVPMSGTFIDVEIDWAIQTTKNGGTSREPNSGKVTLTFDAAGIANPILRYLTWWEIESVNPATFDIMQVSFVDSLGVSHLIQTLNPPADPPEGAPDLNFSSAGFNSKPMWVEHTTDVSGFATGGTVGVVFHFETRDQLYNAFRGWIVKNPRIVSGTSAAAASAASVVMKPNAQARPRIPRPRR